MKITGTGTVRAPVEEVWSALLDPARLSCAIPGCEGLEIIGPGIARVTVTTAMPAVSGTYSGTVSITGKQPPHLLSATVSAAGDQGTVTMDVTVRLAKSDDAGTLIGYEAVGVAGGAIEGVGARLLASAAKRMAAGFLAALDQTLTARRAARVGPLARPGGSPSSLVPDQMPADVVHAAGADARVVVAGAAIGFAGILAGVRLLRRMRRSARG
jgi:carbon monoxide dehydrogenase subunit G